MNFSSELVSPVTSTTFIAATIKTAQTPRQRLVILIETGIEIESEDVAHRVVAQFKPMLKAETAPLKVAELMIIVALTAVAKAKKEIQTLMVVMYRH